MQDLVIVIGVSFGVPTIIALLLSGQWRYLRANLWALAATTAVLINIVVVVNAPEIASHMNLFQELKWNWVGKFANILVTLVVLLTLPKTLREETGILNLPRCNNWKLVATVCTGLLAFFWGAAYLMRDGSLATLEYYAFQSIMPSIDEEFLFRGTVLAMLVAACGKNYSLAGIRIGWGALPIIAFFGIMHGHSILLAGGPIDYPLILITVFITGVAGAGLLWIKEMTSSVWLCVVMHSLMNIGSGFFNQFTP